MKASIRREARSAAKTYVTHDISNALNRTKKPIIKIGKRQKKDTSVMSDLNGFEGNLTIPKRPKSSQGKSINRGNHHIDNTNKEKM